MKELIGRIVSEIDNASIDYEEKQRLGDFVLREYHLYKQRSAGCFNLSLTPKEIDLVLLACESLVRLDLAKQWAPEYKHLRERIERQTGITLPTSEPEEK